MALEDHSSSLSGQTTFGPAFSWLSIGLAVFTALCQGLISALSMMTEASSHWTFRFRLSLAEPWWWTVVSFLLSASLVMSTLAFAAGQGGDPVSVLALSSATFLATVRYMLPAWQQRMYIRTRWLAWTGDSRTGVKVEASGFCGGREEWGRLVKRCKGRLAKLRPTPSDWYGWSLWWSPGIGYDPTDVLRVVGPADVDAEKVKGAVGIYVSEDADPKSLSLLWGRRQGFRPRVSRAIASISLGLLQSSPRTADGHDGRGIVLAMGILGRNKGLKPWTLVYKSSPEICTQLEQASTWTPRPGKVLRSFYHNVLHTQYHGLGEAFVNAAVELALILVDAPSWAVVHWLQNGLEHQSLEMNTYLADMTSGQTAWVGERAATLDAHYRSSYVSMIVSLNAIHVDAMGRTRRAAARRPDLICTGLLMKAQGLQEPSWWNLKSTVELREQEMSGLLPTTDWKTSLAKLLGLSSWPTGFDECPPVW